MKVAMFRPQALAKLQSPEQVDEVLQVVHRRSWIPLGILGGLVLFAVAWSLTARIPLTAPGHAIFLTPGTVVPFQATAGGQIREWKVQVGDAVTRGQVLGMLAQPDIEKQLDSDRAKLAELERRNTEIHALRSRSYDLEKASIARQRAMLEERTAILKRRNDADAKLAEDIHSRNQDYLARQRKSLESTRETTAALGKKLEERVGAYQRLREAQQASVDQLLTAERAAIDNDLAFRNLDLRIFELDVTEIRTAQARLEAQNQAAERENSITQLTLQLRDLENRETELEREAAEQRFLAEADVNDVKRSIERNDEQLRRHREIRSEHDGRILELTAAAGEVIAQGVRLGTLDTRRESDDLMGLVYFRVGDGKKIRPGMGIRITPHTVQQERHGSIRATVVSASAFPVTPEGAANFVGNTEVARALTAGGHQIEVVARLERDPESVSGFRWTSQRGPPIAVTAGTTGTAFADVEVHAPITFVIPILREWTGL